jgi:hypothetical protein
MSAVSVSALVTGFPPQLRVPKPLAGETLAQLVFRNHPDEWRNCVERLERDSHVPKDVCEHLRRGDLQKVTDPAIKAEVERFLNLRLPSHGRTFLGLTELRAELREPVIKTLLAGAPYELLEILWPRQPHPGGDRSAEALAEAQGVAVISLPAGPGREMSWADLLPHVHGKYLWVLPGGTRLFAPTVALNLGRVVRWFESSPLLAMFSDQCFSMVYRTEVLRGLLGQGKALSPQAQQIARLLQESGYQLAADATPAARLTELEAAYGGDGPTTSEIFKGMVRPGASGQPWWKRLARRLFGPG